MGLRIAFIGSKGLPSKGGGERVVEAIIERLIVKGYDISIYAKKSYCDYDNVSNKLKIILIKELRGKHLSAFSYGLFSTIHALARGKYDVIHLHYADFGFIAPLLRLKFKVIGTSHGAEYKREKWNIFAKLFFRFSEILFIRYCNICTSVSLSLSKYYIEKYNKKVYYIPNGVNTKQSRNSHVNTLDFSDNNYILFMAGRIIPTKGLHVLLQANILMGNKIPILIAGEIENIIYKNKLMKLNKPNIKYLGFISDKSKIEELISNSQIFVFPSQYEAMSMALLEVAAQGKMIICSDIEENVDAIQNNAIYFKTNDHHDLANKINEVVTNLSTITKYSNRAYKWVKKHRNWDILVDSYCEQYNNLLNN